MQRVYGRKTFEKKRKE
jgi:hypothetical protein